MNFFNKKKIKVKSESIKDFVKLSIDYYKLEESKDFKTNIIKELIGNKSCLAIVDTELEFKQPKGYTGRPIEELLNLLSDHNIEFKKILIKTAQSISVFGSPIKLNSKNKTKEYIIGFVVSADNIEYLKSIIFCYNTSYYIDFIEDNEENLINEVQAYCEDKDEFHSKFNYSIFDCNFLKNITIRSRAENHKSINEIINRSLL